MSFCSTAPRWRKTNQPNRNQTDLAIKGIIALEAMSRIAQLTGHKDDSTRYSKIAHEYLDFWQAHGIVGDASPPHTNLQYNTNDTYGKPQIVPAALRSSY